MWAALLMGLLLAGSAGQSAAQPSSNSDCALMVPLDEVQRGKGAYLSDCLTLSESGLGGCWTQTENIDTEGCQTCYIAEDSFADALFPVMFSEELDPCPTSVDFTTLYEEEHGTISVVTAASFTSSGCPEGWLFLESTGHCYFKSPNTEKAADQSDAASKCEAEGAWLIAVDSEEENAFLVHSMLWIGFFGETYTGLIKTDGDSEWEWPADAVGGSPDYDCLVDFSDWIEGQDLGCASEYNGGAEGESCMEIFPYEPKGWNPFSCNVGKHYVCEMASSGDSSSSNTSVTETPSPAPTASESTSKPTPAPITLQPTAPTDTVEPTAAATTAEPTSSFTSEPTLSATAMPSMVPSTAEPTAVVTAPTPAPTVSTTPAENATPSPTAPPSVSISASDWEGYNTITVTKTGTWGDASYSIYFVPGEDMSEIPVVEGVSKGGPGASEDEYGVKPGCYRMLVEVPSGEDPRGISWEISGGEPARPEDELSGEGLEGALFAVGGGVCGVGSCHAECLADNFSSADGPTSTSSAVCGGYAALTGGVCSSICPKDDQTIWSFQNMCVSASCDPEDECRVDITAEANTLGADNTLNIDVLVVSNSSTSSSSGDTETSKEFEMAVALWLGVDNEDVTVTGLNGVDMDSESGEDASTSYASTKGSSSRRLDARRNRGRVLQDEGSNSSTSTERYTRYYCSVAPPGASSSDVKELEDSATDSNATSALQSWLSENGGSAWTGVEVVEIDAQVLETVYLVPMSDDDTVGQERPGPSESDSSISRGIVAGVAAAGVAGLIVVIAACIMFRRKRSRAKSSSTTGVVIIRDNDSGKPGGQIIMPFDDAVPVPSATSEENQPSQENKASERSQQKSTNRIGHDSVPSAAYVVTASPAIVTAVNDSAIVVGESRGSSVCSCSSSAPLDPYKGNRVVAGPRSTSRNQRQQQQPGEASMKDSTFHSLEGVGNGGVGAGQRSLGNDGDGILSEGSMAGESEAASRFGLVGVKGAHEMLAGNNWGTKPHTKIPPYGSHSTFSNSRTPVKSSMASENSISSSSSSSSASEFGWQGRGSKQQQQHHQHVSNSNGSHVRYPSTLSDDSDAASSAAWGANYQHRQSSQDQGQRTHESERFDSIPAGDQDSDCESRPATHEQYNSRVGRHASGYSYAGRIGFQPTISESWSGLHGEENESDEESAFYGGTEKERRGNGIGVSSGYI